MARNKQKEEAAMLSRKLLVLGHRIEDEPMDQAMYMPLYDDYYLLSGTKVSSITPTTRNKQKISQHVEVKLSLIVV